MIWGDCPNVHEEQYLRVDDAAICEVWYLFDVAHDHFLYCMLNACTKQYYKYGYY